MRRSKLGVRTALLAAGIVSAAAMKDASAELTRTNRDNIEAVSKAARTFKTV